MSLRSSVIENLGRARLIGAMAAGLGLAACQGAEVMDGAEAVGEVQEAYTLQTLEVEAGTRTGGLDRTWGMIMDSATDSVCWSAVDMNGATQVNVRVSNGEPVGDSMTVKYNGGTIGSVSVPSCGAWEGNSCTASGTIQDPGGTGQLCLVGAGSGWIAALNSLTLSGGQSGDGNGGGTTTATCSDGIKNQGELDIDCGGPCSACGGGTITYQAEASVLTSPLGVEGGVTWGSYSGSGIVDCHGGEGSMTFTANPGAGTYNLVVRYTTGADRDMDLRVNGALVSTPMFTNTGSWFTGWTDKTITGIVLVDGNNSIKLSTNGGSGPNFDRIQLVSTGTGGGASCVDSIQNQGEGGIDCGGPCATACATCNDGIQNQGETGLDCGGPCASCAGGGGNGAVLNVASATRSGGLNRDWGMIFDSAGDSACWSGVSRSNVNEIDILYSNGEVGDSVNFTFNGTTIGNVALPSCTSGGTWDGLCATVTATVPLATGTGTLCAVSVGSGWNGAIRTVTLNSTSTGTGATCSDGVMNQNETGVDCGGVCSACGGGGVNPLCTGAPNPGSKVVGTRLCVDGQPWVMKGVNWDPVNSCGYNGWQDWGHSATDATTMKANNFNTIRTFGIRSTMPLFSGGNPITCSTAATCPDPAHNVCSWDGPANSNICRKGYITNADLDQFHSRGIRVMPTVAIAGGGPDGEWNVNWADKCGDGTADNPSPGGGFNSTFATHITRIGNHPAVIALGAGNEIRYNSWYTTDPGGAWSNCWTITDVVSHANHVVGAIKALSTKPVYVSWGNTWDITTKMPLITQADIISYQIYNELTLDGIFSLHPANSTKPFFVSEFGCDSFNANIGGQDEAAQAYGNVELFRQILDNAKGTAPHRAIGGTIFSYTDGLYKAAGDACVLNNGGVAPGGGPHPDKTFNEENWGILKVDRTPKQSLVALKNLFAGY
jgi:hypothetical protein